MDNSLITKCLFVWVFTYASVVGLCVSEKTPTTAVVHGRPTSAQNLINAVVGVFSISVVDVPTEVILLII